MFPLFHLQSPTSLSYIYHGEIFAWEGVESWTDLLSFGWTRSWWSVLTAVAITCLLSIWSTASDTSIMYGMVIIIFFFQSLFSLICCFLFSSFYCFVIPLYFFLSLLWKTNRYIHTLWGHYWQELTHVSSLLASCYSRIFIYMNKATSDCFVNLSPIFTIFSILVNNDIICMLIHFGGRGHHFWRTLCVTIVTKLLYY